MSTYTVGLLGAGGIANSHLASWLQLGVDVVVYSVEGAAALVSRHGGGRVVGSLDELLEACDAVDVCTPTFTHRELVLAAAAAGKDIVCEKPLALTVQDAAEMVRACADAGVALYPAHVVRFFPAYATMHAAVASGSLGTIAVQRFRRVGAAPVMSWFHDRRLSGGIAMDQMIHDLDFARWNAGEVVSVHATESAGHAAGGDRALPVTAQVILTHASGAVSHVNGIWGSANVGFETRFEVVGDRGLLTHDSKDHPPITYNGFPPASVSGYQPTVAFLESPYLTELREFHRAFLTGVAPRVTAEDGCRAVAIAAAANESIASGDAVTVAAIR